MPVKAIRKSSTAICNDVPYNKDTVSINRLPDDSSDSDSQSNDIPPTDFVRGSSQTKNHASRKEGRETTPALTVRSLRDRNGNYTGTSNPNLARTKVSLGSDSLTSNPKRKSQTSPTGLGAGMKDEYGFTKAGNLKKAKKFGSNGRLQKLSSQKASAKSGSC